MALRVRILLFVAALLQISGSKSAEPPKPQPNPDVTVHAKPKALSAGAVTHDWISFLGPTHNLVSAETKLLVNWPKDGPVLLWEMKRGTGYTSPAIQGERLVYFHRLDDREIVECLHPETGERYWQFAYPVQYQDRYGYNNGPRASPVIDGSKVYTYGAEGLLHCLNLETGEVLWKRDLNTDFHIEPNFFGVGTTPLIEGNLLIINVGAAKGPCVVALDKGSGKQVWAANEPEQNWGPSYASPIPADIQGKHRVLVFAGGESKPPTGGLLSIDPADGKVDFRFPWRSKTYESVNATTPVVFGNQVIITASYQTGGALLDIQPDLTVKTAWTSDEFGCHFTTPISKDGYLYGIDGRHEENSALTCIEVKTGKTMWHDKIDLTETVKVRGKEQTVPFTQGRGSLLWADGHYLLLGEMGHLLWMDLTPEGHKVLARKWLFCAPQTWTPPVLSRGLLYIAQNHQDMLNGTTARLLCFDLRGE